MEARDLAKSFRTKFPELPFEAKEFGKSGETSLWIELDALPRICAALRDDPALRMDWLEEIGVVEVNQAIVLTYFLRSSASADCAILRGSILAEAIDGGKRVPSVRVVWQTAALLEAEIESLFGVRFDFDGSERTMVPWSGADAPLRKAR